MSSLEDGREMLERRVMAYMGDDDKMKAAAIYGIFALAEAIASLSPQPEQQSWTNRFGYDEPVPASVSDDRTGAANA